MPVMLTCAFCSSVFQGQRWRDPAFCSDKHRVAYHRQKRSNNKLHAAIEIIGQETGLFYIVDREGQQAHKRLRMLPPEAIWHTVHALGYVWGSGEWKRPDTVFNLWKCAECGQNLFGEKPPIKCDYCQDFTRYIPVK